VTGVDAVHRPFALGPAGAELVERSRRLQSGELPSVLDEVLP
jgi:hypothetical protein